jgi:type II secretion system protein G
MKFLILSFVLMASMVSISPARSARTIATQTDIQSGLKKGLDQFAIDCGRYPTTSEGFSALIKCPENIPGARWKGPYIDPPQIPQDPWGHDYVYHCPGIHNTNGYDIYSCGFDGISKSGGNDPDDINNWDPTSPHGGNDDYSSNFDRLMDEYGGYLFISSFLILFLGVVRMIAAVFSKQVRASIARHPIAHIIWLILSLIAFAIFINSFPRIAG